MFPDRLGKQNETKEEPIIEETKEEPVIEETKEEPVIEETKEEPVIEETKEEPVIEETKEECRLGTIIECEREVSTDHSERNISSETISNQNIFWP
jgi:hypothetical protein